MKDFFEATSDILGELNHTDKQLFEYVIKNMNRVKEMSIQKFAQEVFLSTTTIFRFTQKLGFSGYSDFINCLLITSYNSKQEQVVPVLLKKGYNRQYIDNATETIRVMSPNQIEKIIAVLNKKPNIYILTDDNTRPIAQYSEKLFIALELHTYAPENAYQLQHLANHIDNNDMLIALSYSGQDKAMIDFIERVFLAKRPFLMSITRADNNTLESLSDANLYIFAEEVTQGNIDLTSCVPMLMILELLVYQHIGQAATI